MFRTALPSYSAVGAEKESVRKGLGGFLLA
jgi:hypothetical protein